MNIYKSMGLNEIHPGVLRELADAVTKTLSVTFEKLWQSGKVLETGKKVTSYPYLKRMTKKGTAELPVSSLCQERS